MSKEKCEGLSSPFRLGNVREPEIILVEGIFDALMLDARGIKNVVALGGSNITEDQIISLREAHIKSVTLLMDNDQAGLEGALAITEKLANENFQVFVIPTKNLGNAKDPDEYVRTKRTGGASIHPRKCRYSQF